MESVVVALLAAVPSTLSAWAAVIAARRSGRGDRKLGDLHRLLSAHIRDGEVHYLPDRRGVRQKGSRG
jgi:hypothetical protein